MLWLKAYSWPLPRSRVKCQHGLTWRSTVSDRKNTSSTFPAVFIIFTSSSDIEDTCVSYKMLLSPSVHPCRPQINPDSNTHTDTHILYMDICMITVTQMEADHTSWHRTVYTSSMNPLKHANFPGVNLTFSLGSRPRQRLNLTFQCRPEAEDLIKIKHSSAPPRERRRCRQTLHEY